MTPLRSHLTGLFGRAPSTDDDTANRPIRANDRKMEWKSDKVKEQQEGISRRALLKYGGGAAGGAGLLGGGWFVWDRFFRKRTPEETVRQCYTALDEGDRERANELVHTDSPTEFGPGVARLFEQNDVTIEETELTAKSDGRAEVRMVILGASSEQERQEVTVNLRTENGAWKLWLE